MLTFLCAVLAACANACASVLQRKANKEVPQTAQMRLELVTTLLRSRVWLTGIAAITLGFLLQAVALRTGELAAVEPILVLELPLSVLIASWVFRGGLGRREWLSVVGMTTGLALLLYVLAPSGGHAGQVPGWRWALALGSAAAALGLLVSWGRGVAGPSARAAIYGVGTGIGFGVTAALTKGMTEASRLGLAHIFTVWQTYAVVASGVASMFLFQNAMHAGKLVASQPGITLSDPVVSVVWGVCVFGEEVRAGWYVLPELAGLAAMALSVLGLARSPLLHEPEGGGAGEPYAAPGPAGRRTAAETG